MARFFEQADPSNILKSLKNKIYGKQDHGKLDNIDVSLGKINKNILNKNTKNYSEILQKLASNSISNEDVQSLTSDLMGDVENQSRMNRYMNAEEIVDCIPYCASALQVISDGILSPDDITKKSIQILSDAEQETAEDDPNINEIRDITKKLEIDDLMDGVIYETLKLGDQFIEICDFTSTSTPVTQTMITENNGYETIREDCTVEYNPDGDFYLQTNKENLREVSVNLKFKEDNSTIVNTEDEQNGKQTVEVKNVRLVQHDPRCIIKLQSKRFKMCLGYLVLPTGSAGGGGVTINQMSSSSLGTSAGLGAHGRGIAALMPGEKAFGGVDNIYRELLQKVKKHVKDEDIYVNRREVLLLLMRAIKEIDVEEGGYESGQSIDLPVRFVPTNRMQHYKLPSSRFFPYGEGIFYKATFQSKLLIALETAVTMKRISDSTDKRVIYFESGITREAKNILEELKTKFKKRKFSIDSVGTVSSIPSQLTSFEDIYVPQVKGRRFIEFDTLNKPTDIRDVTEELKYVRDSIIAGLRVPNAYLNMEEQLSNKAALAFENALFAQTIVSYQQMFSKQLHEMMNKIVAFTKGSRISESVNITFSPPKMLQMERDAEKYDMTSRIVQALQDMGVPKEWAVKQYVDLPWDKIKNYRTDSELSQKETPPDEDEGMSGYGGMGGGVGGAGGGTPLGGGF